MNVLKICNKRSTYRSLSTLLTLLFGIISQAVASEGQLTELAKPIDTSQVMGVVAGLFFVLLLFFILVYALKKLPAVQGNRTGILKVLDTLYLGSNEKIVLLQVADKQILLGVNSQSIGTLHVVDEPIEIEMEAGKSLFKDRLTEYLAGKIHTAKNNNE